MKDLHAKSPFGVEPLDGAGPLGSAEALGESDASRADAADERPALLFPGRPQDVLRRIVPADPLAICARAARRISARALFLDPRCVARRAFALVAQGALTWRGTPALETWLEERVDAALEELLEEEADRLACREPLVEGRGDPAGPHRRGTPEPHHDAFAAPLGLDRGALELGRARFHALPDEDRRAFCSAALELVPAETAGDETDRCAESALARARRALDVLRGSLPPRPPTGPLR